jgi:hypothetical protein
MKSSELLQRGFVLLNVRVFCAEGFYDVNPARAKFEAEILRVAVAPMVRSGFPAHAIAEERK